MPKAKTPKAAASLKAPMPKNWARMYRAIAVMRRVLWTPVDVIGCHMLADRTADAETQRFQTLCALMLSSQTRDQCTAEAMRNLIALKGGLNAPNIAATVSEATLKTAISTVCFYNNKSKFLKKTAQKIVDDHDGTVPSELKALVALPGVGYKMAGIFLECADGKVEAIGVDTHMHRNFNRYGWVKTSKPDDTMRALMTWLPREYWKNVNEMHVGFGQFVCKSKGSLCGSCLARHWCPAAQLDAKQKAAEKKLGFATMNDESRAARDLEDLENLKKLLKPAQDKIVEDFGVPKEEREWIYPSAVDDDEEDGGPKKMRTAHVPKAKKK